MTQVRRLYALISRLFGAASTTLAVWVFCAHQAQAGLFSPDCPTAEDLDKGIVISDPARVGVLYKRYRRIEGPYIGWNYINGILADRTTISYAGLFTYKHWINGEVRQYEEPQVDLEALLRFEPGTQHAFESIRHNPQKPERKWRVSAVYHINEAADLELGGCTYQAVQLRLIGTLTYPDGETKPIREENIFVPELMLKVTGTGVYYDDIDAVRPRTWIDADKWPFTDNPGAVLAE